MDNIPKTPPEIPAEEKQPEYSYLDLHKETPSEIAENKEIPEEEKPEDKKEEEAPKPEEKEEVLDTGKLAEEVADKVVEKTRPPEEPVKPKTEDQEYQEWATAFKEEQGKEPSWTDVAMHLKEEAIKAIDEREAEKAKQAEEENKQKAENEKQLTENFNALINDDLSDLYSKGKLSPVKDKDNPSDQGIVERKALFQKMLEVNQARAAEGKRPVYSIKEIYYEHYEKPNAQPPGEDAPVSLGKGASPQGEEQELDYNKDVKGTTWGSLRNLLKKN